MWRLARSKRSFILGAFLAMPLTCHGQADPQSRRENQSVAPFRIVGNIYYVGASDVTSFLIVTPLGHILLDGGFAETAPQIEANIQRLGFKLSDVKFLLNSHAHYDHAGGLAELKKRTGAQMVAMQGDAPLLASGGHGDFFFGDRLAFPPVKPDRVIHDGDTITLGGVTMTAHLTAGHTRGCTTWAMTTDNGKPLHVVFIGSMSVLPGYRLAGKESYPGMAADYEKSFRVLKSLPCDVFLGAHGSFFDLAGKRASMTNGAAQNPFIDPAGYRAYVEGSEATFETELRRQQHASDPPQGSPTARSADGVMQVEREWLEALRQHDAATLDRILASEWTDNDWQGRFVTRSDYLAYFARTPAPSVLAEQHFAETNVRFFANGDVVIVTGMVVTDATNASGAKKSQRSRFTDVFVWRDARWQAVSAQETHLSEAK